MNVCRVCARANGRVYRIADCIYATTFDLITMESNSLFPTHNLFCFAAAADSVLRWHFCCCCCCYCRCCCFSLISFEFSIDDRFQRRVCVCVCFINVLCVPFCTWKRRVRFVFSLCTMCDVGMHKYISPRDFWIIKPNAYRHSAVSHTVTSIDTFSLCRRRPVVLCALVNQLHQPHSIRSGHTIHADVVRDFPVN